MILTFWFTTGVCASHHDVTFELHSVSGSSICPMPYAKRTHSFGGWMCVRCIDAQAGVWRVWRVWFPSPEASKNAYLPKTNGHTLQILSKKSRNYPSLNFRAWASMWCVKCEESADKYGQTVAPSHFAAHVFRFYFLFSQWHVLLILLT